jgi:hypothetical protein
MLVLTSIKKLLRIICLTDTAKELLLLSIQIDYIANLMYAFNYPSAHKAISPRRPAASGRISLRAGSIRQPPARRHDATNQRSSGMDTVTTVPSPITEWMPSRDWLP